MNLHWLRRTLRQNGPADYRLERMEMIRDHLIAQGIHSVSVLDAMYHVPRQLFMAGEALEHVYHNHAAPIEEDQTISQPFIVAAMTELCGARKGLKVLDVGTGSGYQAAVLAYLGAEVYSIEINPLLARRAKNRLSRLGYKVKTTVGDGYYGWVKKAPFHAIVVAAAPEVIPSPLKEQLIVGGILVLPVGPQDSQQKLIAVRRKEDSYEEMVGIDGVGFVPLIGHAKPLAVEMNT